MATETWVGLFRGVNVGGRNSLPMAVLRADLETLGLENVATYIQSGNVVFDAKENDSPERKKSILDLVERRHGFRPELLLLSVREFEEVMAANPFPEAEAEPRTLHVFLLAAIPSAPDLGGLETLRKESERFHLSDRAFYLHAPDGIGRSRLAASLETRLGVAATGRNLRTMKALASMVCER